MPQNERIRVWKGELKRTSGGLYKKDLIKNKRGKIVSKKKSAAAKKNKDNNLGNWLRSKNDQFLSKGLKAENIVRKGKVGRKAFKKPDVPEEKQSEVPKPKKAVVVKKAPKKKVVVKAPKKKKAPPKISKSEPMKAGEKEELGKISVGNIKTGAFVKPKDETPKQYWVRKAKVYRSMKKDLKWVENKLGPKPPGVYWNAL